jgi:hypothetical protein
MIARQQDISGSELCEEIARERQRRRAAGTLVDPLPGRFELDDAQHEDWRSRWATATRSAPVTFDEAHAIAERFLGPVLGGEVRDADWSCDEQRWSPGKRSR